MKLDEWKPRETDSADKRNQVIRAVNENLPVIGGPGIETSIKAGGNGTAVSVTPEYFAANKLIAAKVVSAGPNGEDYTDYRYWCQLLRNEIDTTNHTDGSDLDLVVTNAHAYNAGESPIVTGYNIAEFVAGTHSLTLGTYLTLAPVYLDAVADNGAMPRARFLILGAGGAQVVLLKITSNATGSGEYNGKSVTGISTTTPTTNLTSPPTGMTVASAEDILFLNMAEAGVSGHALAINKYAAGVVVGATTETPPRKIVWGFTNAASLPTPTALYQVLQVTAFTSTTVFTLNFDWTRAHS